jgi:hypothetical protein
MTLMTDTSMYWVPRTLGPMVVTHSPWQTALCTAVFVTRADSYLCYLLLTLVTKDCGSIVCSTDSL